MFIRKTAYLVQQNKGYHAVSVPTVDGKQSPGPQNTANFIT